MRSELLAMAKQKLGYIINRLYNTLFERSTVFENTFDIYKKIYKVRSPDILNKLIHAVLYNTY